MKKLVFLTGAGMSVESGFKTFRGNDGLWENYPVEQIATHEGWEADPTLVTNFYNMLRHKLYAAQPNEGHKLIKELEKDFDVTVITQNVDNLHEKAGSKNVIHLHGELSKVCSSRDPYDYRYIKELPEDDCEVEPGTEAGDGSLLRPFIVFFGESAPMIEPAARSCTASRYLRHYRNLTQRLSCCRSDFIYQASHSYLSDRPGCRKHQWILQDRAHHERGFRWYEGTEGNIGKIKTFRI